TALMGATLPSIARLFAAQERSMSGLATLYAANTVGAVAGSVVTGFYLLPRWDVMVASGVAATVNFAIGAVALRVAPTRASAPEPERHEAAAGASSARAVYAVAALSGMTALGAQVVWTR